MIRSHRGKSASILIDMEGMSGAVPNVMTRFVGSGDTLHRAKDHSLGLSPSLLKWNGEVGFQVWIT